MKHRPWDASRVAYLLTAAMADSAGRIGVIVPGDDVDAEWSGHDKSTQLDILAALGAQTRFALEMLRDELNVEIEMDWDSTARAVCSEALLAARELIQPRPAIDPGDDGARATPECTHCRGAIAKALCSLQIQAYFRLGFTPAMIAAMCRQSANEAETVPRH